MLAVGKSQRAVRAAAPSPQSVDGCIDSKLATLLLLLRRQRGVGGLWVMAATAATAPPLLPVGYFSSRTARSGIDRFDSIDRDSGRGIDATRVGSIEIEGVGLWLRSSRCDAGRSLTGAYSCIA